MRIKMLVGLASDRFSISPGDEYECDDAEAIRHIEAGHAVPIADKAKVQKAVKARPAETR